MVLSLQARAFRRRAHPGSFHQPDRVEIGVTCVRRAMGQAFGYGIRGRRAVTTGSKALVDGGRLPVHACINYWVNSNTSFISNGSNTSSVLDEGKTIRFCPASVLGAHSS